MGGLLATAVPKATIAMLGFERPKRAIVGVRLEAEMQFEMEPESRVAES